MASYNTSSAYAFTELENAVQNPVKKPEVKVHKGRRELAASILTPGALAGFVIVMALLSLMVYNRLQLNELTREISSLSSEMEVLHSESVKLNASLESTISPREIVKMAEAMGMQKCDEFQTERIYLYQDDKIERTEDTPGQTTGESVKLAVTSLFVRFKEYLAVR